MFDFYANKTTLINIMNNKKGINLKKLYAKENNLELDKIYLRLIYKGFEITDDFILNKVKFDEISNISVIMRFLTIKNTGKLDKSFPTPKKTEEKYEEEIKNDENENNENENNENNEQANNEILTIVNDTLLMKSDDKLSNLKQEV